MNENIEFQSFGKLSRLNREIIITEKLDGTNAQIFIMPGRVGEVITDSNVIAVAPDGSQMRAGSRNKWITPKADNYCFAGWCERNHAELFKLGPGRHFGEWFGCGINRAYGMEDRRFALFNTSRWSPASFQGPRGGVMDEGHSIISCCSVVPTLWRGPMDTIRINQVAEVLRESGSVAAPGFANPEGIVIYHTAANQLFKVTLKNDETPKSLVK